MTKLKIQRWIYENILSSIYDKNQDDLFFIIRDFRSEITDNKKEAYFLNGEITKLKKQLNNKNQLLANENAQCLIAKTIHVTDHAIDRYRQRILKSPSREDVRKIIYSGAISHLATLDKLQDGRYPLAHGVTAILKDMTVTSIIPTPKGRYS